MSKPNSLNSIWNPVKIQVKELKIQTRDLGPEDPVNDFWKFYKVELALDPKTSFHPWELFYRYANLQKFLMSESICFKGSIRVNRSQFSRQQISRIWLTISTFKNFISSLILGYGVCMSTRSKSNIFKPSWRTPYPILCNSEFILVDTIP
jgi:hypothetical protein